MYFDSCVSKGGPPPVLVPWLRLLLRVARGWVGFHMNGQTTSHAETFPTGGTREGFLPCVRSHVASQMTS